MRPLLPLLLLAPVAQAQQLPPRWEQVPTKLQRLKEDEGLARAVPATPLEEGTLLFEVGQPGWRWRRLDDGKLEVELGKKKEKVAPGGELTVPGLYPGEAQPVKLVFRRAAGDGPPALAAAQVVVAKLGKQAFTFVDRDANGYFDDLDVDAVLEGEPKDVAKDPPEAVREKLVAFRGWLTVAGKRWFVGLRPATRLVAGPIGDAVDEAYLLHTARLNHVRRQGGVPPAGLAEDLIAGGEAHSAYCKRNGEIVHEEDRSKPGYTPEGDRAGRAGCVGPGETPLEGLEGMLECFYHRTYYLRPLLRETGPGCKDGRYTCDVLTRGDSTTPQPILYPYDRQAGVSPKGALREQPDPKPAGLPAVVATFITMSFNPGARPELLESKVVRLPAGTEVKHLTSTPQNPPPGARDRFPDNDASFCLYPQEPLEHDAIYEVTMRWRNNALAPPQTTTWRFRTARKKD